eukprot:CAMPEP_0206214224 /NCGR_PEP_ID=MMETSP0047_2-20121206/1551_1 /ASSEMBLY_ACC=CAM_ASM_000192 /TAXON_ID=195065 /ORGANISM="Chroomonas mesostigmatica_cf, Strain CCMP1168" /LENGTH=172 /DNA_ID=CAMNT_0053636445 /DNA_START=180 /DNA_END=699 /DNA_ORIENTATION=+
MAQERGEGAVNLIVSSPFLRCIQTAAEIAAAMGVKRIILDNGLCEVMLPRNVSEPPTFIPPLKLPLVDPFLGQFTYKASTEPAPSWPEQLTQARVVTPTPSGGFHGTSVLLVAHGDTVAQYVAYTRGIPDDCVYSVPPCSVAAADVTLQGREVLWSQPWMSGDILTLDDMVE